jgi:hypothetical protein
MKLIDKYSCDLQELNTIYNEKIPVFIERQISTVNKKKMIESEIKSFIDQLWIKYCCETYYHNPHPDMNAYYSIDESGVRLIPSDCIMFRIWDVIPSEFQNYKGMIWKQIKNRIREKYWLTYNPPKSWVDKIVERTALMFASANESLFLLYLIGMSINRKNYLMFDEGIILLWQGSKVQNVIDFFQEFIHSHVRHASSLFHQIKQQYNTKYDPDKVFMLHFPSQDRHRLFKILRKEAEVFFIVCNYIYNNHSLDDFNNVHNVTRLHPFKDSSVFFNTYVEKNVIENENLMQLHEIQQDMKEYLTENHLPENLVTQEQIRTYVESKFDKIEVSNFKFYKGSLRVSSNYEIFENFCQHRLDQDSLPDKDNLLTSKDVYKIYLNWHTTYHMFLQEIPCRLFEAFLQHTFQDRRVSGRPCNWKISIRATKERRSDSAEDTYSKMVLNDTDLEMIQNELDKLC